MRQINDPSCMSTFFYFQIYYSKKKNLNVFTKSSVFSEIKPNGHDILCLILNFSCFFFLNIVQLIEQKLRSEFLYENYLF